jgi:hypothetical protein
MEYAPLTSRLDVTREPLGDMRDYPKSINPKLMDA